jgi:RNA polymerase sigma factor (sigma-70 family)
MPGPERHVIGRTSLSKPLPAATDDDRWGQRLGVTPQVADASEAHPRAGEEAAQRFVRLYRELFPSVYGYVRYRVGDLHLAEDITAQVFERALARLASVREPDRVRAWLFTIARNAIVDERRRRRPAAELEAADLVEHLWVDSPEQEAEQREEWRRLVAYIGGLSDRERELLGLKFAAGLTNREVGQVLNLSEDNVAQIAHRAIAKLRRRFDEETER